MDKAKAAILHHKAEEATQLWGENALTHKCGLPTTPEPKVQSKSQQQNLEIYDD